MTENKLVNFISCSMTHGVSSIVNRTEKDLVKSKSPGGWENKILHIFEHNCHVNFEREFLI